VTGCAVTGLFEMQNEIRESADMTVCVYIERMDIPKKGTNAPILGTVEK